MRKVAIFFMICLTTMTLSAQRKESLALFPFTGGNQQDGTAIVSSLARQRVLRDAFNRVTLVTQNTVATMNFEQRFQRDSGLTDADSIFELGKALNAAYVIAGNITRFGDRNLVIVSVMDVESLQQIAGDYRTYRNIEEIDALIPDMAQKLARLIVRDTRNLPGLSVPPFNISREVDRNTAMVLAQILACDLANGSRYAVLPRTDSLETVLTEHQRQRDGTTDQERVRRLGAGRNAQYVLSGSVQRLGTLNKFATDILDINGDFIDGHEELYTDFSQGFEIMPRLAAQLGGAGVANPSPTTPPPPSSTSQPASNMVRINGGTFMMGSAASEAGRDSDEGPRRQVTISPFLMGRHEVTQKEYQEVMGVNPSHFSGDTLPVEMVSWFDAIEYCNRLSQREGLTPAYTISGSGDSRTVRWNQSANGYRLPTEAEWEYAARAGTTTPFNTGENITIQQANFNNSRGRTAPVGSYAANAWGLHDMHGNVWEWVWDWFGTYPSNAQIDPMGASSGSDRVSRGGSWGAAGNVRSANRSCYTPSRRCNNLGFRVVRPQF